MYNTVPLSTAMTLQVKFATALGLTTASSSGKEITSHHKVSCRLIHARTNDKHLVHQVVTMCAYMCFIKKHDIFPSAGCTLVLLVYTSKCAYFPIKKRFKEMQSAHEAVTLFLGSGTFISFTAFLRGAER